MSKIDDFKKRYKISSKEEEEEEQKRKPSASSIAEFKKKYNITTTDEADKLGSYNPSNPTGKTGEVISSNFNRMGTSTGIEGYKKYLEDVEATKNAPKYDLNNDGKDSWWEKVLGYLGGNGGGVVDTTLPNAGVTQTINDLRADESHKRPSNDWSAKQKSEFGELYLESPDKAFAYAERTNAENNKRKEEQAISKIQSEATENFGAGLGHTLGAIATAPLGMADYLGDLAYSVAGRDNAPDGNVSPFEYSQAVTGGISTHLNEKGGTVNLGILGERGWGDVYGLGTSIAQSMVSAYTLGGAGTLVSYFGQGAAAGVDEALARGASDGQAILYGAALGTFEGVAEMVGIDNLFKLGSASTLKGLIKNVLKQSAAEGLEEGFTAITSEIADRLIMQDKSNFNILVEQLMAQGMSEADAKNKAFKSTLGDIAFDTIAGAISGSVSGGLHSGVKTAITNANAKKNFGGQAQDIVNDALASENADVKAVGEKYQEKLNDNKKLSGWNLSELLEVTDTQKVKSAVEAQLTKLGESGDVSAIADVITKQVQGLELSKKEQAIIDGSKYGQRVVNTLDRENIKSGEYDTRWAKDIGTRRLNADVYNKSAYDLLSDAIDAERKAALEPRETDAVTENATVKENAVESEISASVEGAKVASEGKVSQAMPKATMTNSEGNEVAVKPQRFSVTESGEIGVETDGGEVVKASEVDFGESDIGLVHQAAVDMSSRVGGFSVDTANVFVRGYDAASGQSAGAYIDGWISAYKFGAMKNPPPLSALAANPKTAQLSVEQRKNAYNFGRAFGNEAVAEKQAKIDSTVSINAGKDSQNATKTTKKGRVIFDGAKYGKNLNERQRASLKALNFISKALGVDIYVDKLAKGENGWYDPADRSIHVDLNAGVEGEALLLNAASHEISHDIRAVLPEKFNTLADAVFEEYNKRFGEHTMADLIEAKIDFLKEKGDITEDMTEEQAYDLAYEEVICDCLETMLVDSDAITALSKNIYAKDKGLWEKIRDFFARIVERIKAAYANVIPDTEEGQRFRDLGEGAERIKNLWVEAIVELSEVDKTTGEGKVKHSYSSIAYSFFGDKKVTVNDFENGSYTETEGYKKYVENCLNNMRQTSESFNEEVARKEIEDSIAGIVKVAVAMKKAGYDILDNHAKREAKDSKDRLLFSSLEPNSDYFTSSDISTICDKRINFAEIYDEIVRREEALGVPVGKRFFNNVDNYFILHKIMAEKGLTQPCRQCYVESMRKNLAPMAKAFLKLMQETDPNNTANDQLFSKGKPKPNNTKLREKLLETIEAEEYDITADKLTVEMLTTEDGLAQLKLQAPLIYEAFNSFYGQSKPKMPKSATPFRFGELTALLTDENGKIKKGLIEKIKSTGGFRLQSYSDFQIQNFADVLQVIFEAGTLGLNGHAYTKVPAFLDATKGTNLKRNISIFMYNDNGEWKIDRNDSFPYELEKIYDIVKSDKQGNTSIIAVSQNEMMAAFIMANDNIGYFIPFHKSGMKMGTVRETVVKEDGREIKGYSGIKDHTRQQTEVWAKTTADHKALTKVKKGINIYDFWDFDNEDNLSREGLIEKNVRAYIDACNEAGYLPKFREYVTNNSKVLNAVLNYSKQLGFVSQNATIDEISFEYKGYRIPYGYYKCLGDFGMFTPDGEASSIERLSLKDYNFDEAVEFFSNAESLRRTEILQQIANGEERGRYITGDKKNMTTAEIAEEVQSKRNQVVEEVVNKKVKHSHTVDKKAAYSATETKITADMTEEERYEALKKRSINNIPLSKAIHSDVLAKIPEISSWDDINKYLGKDKRNLIQKLTKEFGVFDKEYINEDIELSFVFSGNNFRESYNKQGHNYIEFAKMFSVFDEVIESAVGIEIHNRTDYKPDPTLNNVFVLMSAYQDGDFIVPVKLEVKQFKDKQNTLYVAISLEKIKMTEVLKQGNTGNGVTQNSRSVDISIAQIFAKINPSDRNFLKYIPDGFLDGKQIAAKKEALGGNSDILHQYRTTNGMKPRTLLANALETTAQNDIERQKLAQYKEKIELLNAEEQKLYELREQIKELSFKKGTRDTQAIKKLQFEANQAANRINTYDRQLFNLESTKALKGVLEREKAQARKRAEEKADQRRKEAVARVKESAAKTQRELMNRYQESRKKATEGRNKTAMRHKIRDVVKDLNKLLNRGTKDRNVKEEIRETVASSLALAEVIFSNDITNEDIVRLGVDSVTEKESKLLNEYSDLLDTIDALYDKREYFYGTEKVREELLAKVGSVEEQISKVRNRLTTLNRQLSDVFERERARLNKATASQLMANLASEYHKLKDSDTDYIRAAYDEYIFTRLDALKDSIGGTVARDMSLNQLTEVYDAYKMVEHFVRNANKAFKSQKGETIMQMAEAVNGQVRDIAGQPYKRNAINAAVQRVGWKLLKPFVAFRTIGSVTLTNLYKELRVGEDVFYNDVKAAQTFIEEQYKKHNYKSWDMKKPKEFTSKGGKTFQLTLEQRLSMYAYYKREKAHKHIVEGGIVFENSIVTEKNKLGIPIAYDVTTKDAFNLSEETFAEIANSLTEDQKAFVDAMQEYLSTVMGEKGNEVSMALHGVKLFKEEFYLPIKSSEFYMNFKPEEAGEVKLKSPAFSKETTPHANNPIVLHNFTDLWAEHVNNMSMYHSFVLALEDFTRVYNYKTKTDAKVETMDTKATLETAYPGVTKYINKFLKDMNGGVRGETVGWAEKLTSLSKKGAVLGSWSVTVQQSSAVMRAMAMVNPKYFATTTHQSINLLKHKQDFAELKKYAPIAGIKEMGRFDVGMGQGTVDWIKSNKTLMEKGEDFLSAAPAFMDEVTWVTIWNAVKRETANKNPKLNTNSDEFLKLAGERFTDVISMTQVYDSVFSRSDLMRNKSWIAKATTAFMAEPTTTLNMIWDCWVTAKRSGSVKGYVKATTVTGGAIMASTVLNAALKSIIMAMRDDDEDESYAEKYIESLIGEIKDNLNPLSLVPFAKDIVSIFRGYDVERMDMALISDFKNAIDAFDSDSKTLYEKWSGFIGATSAFFGVPIKNVERDIRGLTNTIFGKTEDTTVMGILNAIGEGWSGEDKSNGQQLYEAMLNGDSEQIERVKGRFKDETAIQSAIRKALRENDPRIKEAAVARNKGDIAEYMKIAKSIIAEGHFKQDDVVAAINSEISAMNKGETSSTPSDKVVSLYKIEDYYAALEGGTSSVANTVKEDLIATDVANGKDRDEAEESFYSRFASHIRNLYETGEVTDYKAKDMLVRYGDKTSDEAASKVQYWSFKMQYPDYDLSESAVSKYYSDVKPSGISVEIYYDYSKQRSKAEGVDLNGDGKTDSGSVKREVMEIINSLPISSYQKDALYYLNGWASSTLWEAPWH